MIVFVVINIVLLIYLNTYWIHNIPLSHTYAYLKWFFIDYMKFIKIWTFNVWQQKCLNINAVTI